MCWRLSSRWREENYFRYARTRFALDALDSYAAAPDDPDRMVPNPAKKTAAARIRQAEAAAQAAETARDAALLQLRSPAPGQAAYLTNQVINALAAPVEAAWRDLDEAGQAAAAIPARVPLGELAPDMVRLDAETKQITHAIRMAAYNAETTLARALDGHYARAGDEAYALIREALTASGDICPGNGELLIRLDPLTAPRRTQALAALCDQLTAVRRPLSRHRPRPALRGQTPPKPCIKDLPMSGVLVSFKDQIAKAAAEGTWTEQQTERILLAAARVGQHLFALNVLANCGGRCVFCGLNPGPFGRKRMLVAGHIKPWKDSTSAERMDLRNGLAACPSHDVAFDTGLLTVDASLQVHVSAALANAVRADPLTRQYYGRPPLRDTILLPDQAQRPAASTSTGTGPTSSPTDQGPIFETVFVANAIYPITNAQQFAFNITFATAGS